MRLFCLKLKSAKIYTWLLLLVLFKTITLFINTPIRWPVDKPIRVMSRSVGSCEGIRPQLKTWNTWQTYEGKNCLGETSCFSHTDDKPMFYANSNLPVYNIAPLMKAGAALLGTRQIPRGFGRRLGLLRKLLVAACSQVGYKVSCSFKYTIRSLSAL